MRAWGATRAVGVMGCALAWLMGCSTDPSAPSCLPGAQLACACVGGGEGAQICGTDRVLGPCMCPDAGGASGMDVALVDTPDAAPAVADRGADDVAGGDRPGADREPASTDHPTTDRGALDTGALPDGCASNTPANCCGVVCPTGPNTQTRCVEGACRSSCATAFADCDGVPANGCEVLLTVSTQHCGACNRACATGQVCVSGVCTSCASNETACPGECADLWTNVAHCGACNRPCAAGEECAGMACRAMCGFPEGFECRFATPATGRACCVGNRECGPTGPAGDTIERCGAGLNQVCASDRGCLRSAGGHCERGRCCRVTGDICVLNQDCCSERCVATSSGFSYCQPPG